MNNEIDFQASNCLTRSQPVSSVFRVNIDPYLLHSGVISMYIYQATYANVLTIDLHLSFVPPDKNERFFVEFKYLLFPMWYRFN